MGQVVGIYIFKLAEALDLPRPQDITTEGVLFDSSRSDLLPELTKRLLRDQSEEEGGEISSAARNADQSEDEILNTGVLARSYRFLGRVVRAAVPIQALMLLLLGVSSIVPLEQDELICSLQNNLQRSLEPMLQWSNGPPPI